MEIDIFAFTEVFEASNKKKAVKVVKLVILLEEKMKLNARF